MKNLVGALIGIAVNLQINLEKNDVLKYCVFLSSITGFLNMVYMSIAYPIFPQSWCLFSVNSPRTVCGQLSFVIAAVTSSWKILLPLQSFACPSFPSQKEVLPHLYFYFMVACSSQKIPVILTFLFFTALCILKILRSLHFSAYYISQA